MGSNCFRVLTLVQNLGKGGAVRRGVLVARGRRILFADADGATTFSELDKLMKALPGAFIVFLDIIYLISSNRSSDSQRPLITNYSNSYLDP